MEYFKLRCDTEDPESLKPFLDRYVSYYLVSIVEEHDTNPHIHAYLETRTKQPTLRKWLRATYGAGNRHYSLKTLGGEKPLEYLGYCIKVGLHSAFLGVKQEDVLKEAEEHDKKVKAQMKEKKKNRRPVWMKIIEEMEITEEDDTLSVVDKIIEYHVENETLIREFQLTAYAQTILCKFNISGYKNTLQGNILKNLTKSMN